MPYLTNSTLGQIGNRATTAKRDMPERSEHGDGATPRLPTVAYQGVPGSYSFDACGEAEPDRYAVPCTSFEDVLKQVRDGKLERALVPIANSSYGRVSDILRLLPDAGLHIVGEHFMPIRHQLLGCPGARLSDVRVAESHPVALGQCRRFLMAHDITASPVLDTAGAAAGIAHQGDSSKAAIASESAGTIYALERIAPDIQDDDYNTTRFLIMAREPVDGTGLLPPTMTSFFISVRNIPAALHKALGSFANAGVNMVKIESYLGTRTFTTAEFYLEIEGHPGEERVRIAMEELKGYCTRIAILGSYPAHSFRSQP